ncbi:MAG: NAD(P)/FAD-dependent oxidoreductase [Actinomycetota bacterium]
MDNAPAPRHRHYDVVVVGARAAGASTAMLLARSGLRVLAIDRQTYGSDTLSSHALMRGAVRRLANWGLLDELWDRGTPVIRRTSFGYGDEALTLDIRPEPGVPGLAAPRRTLLDPVLVDGAVAAGVEVLHETRFLDVTRSATGRVDGIRLATPSGEIRTVGAGLVIGADGVRSTLARAVEAPITRQGRHASAYTMRYYRDLDVDRDEFRWLYRLGCGGGVIPTSGDAVCVFGGMPPARFAEVRSDVTAAHHATIRRLDPTLADAVERATPVGPIRSFPGLRGQFRQAHGAGWALVGDAGYFKDPYAAHGITDAFRDAELLTEAVLTDDLAGYEARRDELSLPLFEILDRIASYDWDLEQLAGLHFGLSKAMRAEDDQTLTIATAA